MEAGGMNGGEHFYQFRNRNRDSLPEERMDLDTGDHCNPRSSPDPGPNQSQRPQRFLSPNTFCGVSSLYRFLDTLVVIAISHDVDQLKQSRVFQTPTMGATQSTTSLLVHTDGEPRRAFLGRRAILNPQSERYQEECLKI